MAKVQKHQGKVASGSSKAPPQTADDKMKEKMAAVDPSLKVWVGGLPEDTTWQGLQKHFADKGCKPQLTNLMKKGTACLAYKSAGNVASAIAKVNGSKLKGAALEVDVWARPEKKEKTPKATASKPKKPNAQASKGGGAWAQLAKALGKGLGKGQMANVVKKMLKGAGKGKTTKATDKYKATLAKVDPSLKVWVGGLSAGTTWKDLQKHFEEAGSKPQTTSLMKKGTACLAYKSAEDVATAVAALNNSDLKGSTLEVDVWTKPEKS